MVSALTEFVKRSLGTQFQFEQRGHLRNTQTHKHTDPNSDIIYFGANISIAALLVVLVGLYLIYPSIHFIVMFCLSLGLLFSGFFVFFSFFLFFVFLVTCIPVIFEKKIK